MTEEDKKILEKTEANLVDWNAPSILVNSIYKWVDLREILVEVIAQVRKEERAKTIKEIMEQHPGARPGKIDVEGLVDYVMKLDQELL